MIYSWPFSMTGFVQSFLFFHRVNPEKLKLAHADTPMALIDLNEMIYITRSELQLVLIKPGFSADLTASLNFSLWSDRFLVPHYLTHLFFGLALSSWMIIRLSACAAMKR